jgi:hypothetical protein
MSESDHFALLDGDLLFVFISMTSVEVSSSIVIE